MNRPFALQLFKCNVFPGVGTWTLPDELVVTDVEEVSPAQHCFRELWSLLHDVCCTEAIVFYSTEKTVEAKMMKAGGTEIGKTLAEKSRGLFSANDWQCKTYVLHIARPCSISLVFGLNVQGFSVCCCNIWSEGKHAKRLREPHSFTAAKQIWCHGVDQLFFS